MVGLIQEVHITTEAKFRKELPVFLDKTGPFMPAW